MNVRHSPTISASCRIPSGEHRRSERTPAIGRISTSGAALLALLLVLGQSATGCAVADIHTHHHSSTSTHGTHRHQIDADATQITRYRDGHRIVIQQGGHTDVTVQRRGTMPGDADLDGPFGYAPPATHTTHRFARPERLGSAAIDDTATPDPAATSARDRYRQRMFERLDGAPAASFQ